MMDSKAPKVLTEMAVGLPERDRIILADDSPDALNLMTKALENKGFDVIQATSGTECMDKFVNNDCNLVVLDFMMPGSNGIEILRKIRKYRDPEELPVVMITARQSKELLKIAVSNGVNDFMLKPIRGADFANRIERLLIKLNDRQISQILNSLNVSDPSTLDPDTRQNLNSQNLMSYPFSIGDVKCCAILETGKNPHMVAKIPPEKMAEQVVLIAKGGFLWNAIWPRRLKPKFSVTKRVFNDNTDLSELLEGT